MMTLSIVQSVAAFLLGVLVSVMLSGAQTKPLCGRKLTGICLVLLAAQGISLVLLGYSATREIYPLIVHLPLWALLVLLFQTPKLQTAVSILVAYQYCQLPRWVASLGLVIPEEHWLYHILYIPVAGLFLLLMRRYLASSIRRFMERSRKVCLLTGLVPVLYYVFDYVSAVYTGMLNSGNVAAVQFMPSVVSVAYLVFTVLYNSELEKQIRVERERDVLAAQLHQSKIALSAMKDSQERTRQYRHDMRHHFTLLQVLAAENNMEKVQQYLRAAQQDIEALAPAHYCSNEVVNLLMAYYAREAKARHVKLRVTAELPSQLSCSETELCSLLSNGLENAIYAASQVETPNRREVSVRLGIHRENLLIQIENTYTGTLFWQDGLPCTEQKGHGFGTRSIRAIVRAHGGEAIFRVKDGVFQLRILFPCDPDGKAP